MAHSRTAKLGQFEIKIEHRRKAGYSHQIVDTITNKVICKTGGFISDSAAEKAGRKFINRFNKTVRSVA